MSDVQNQTTAEEISEDEYPSASSGWFVVILLTLAYIFSYIDRAVLGFLVEDIKADFNFTDTQMGLLGGLAFTIFYATMGIPFGWLADRKSRKTIVAAGVFVWSVATAASGLVRSFAGLFVARMMVGAGEATLSPCSISMISDMFPPKSRARAIAVYSSALSIGIGLGSLFFSKFYAYVQSLDLTAFVAYGIEKPWHLVFVALGIPGILIAIAIMLIKEPKRQKSSSGDVIKPGSLKDAANTILSNKTAYLGIFFMASVMTICAYATAFWNVPFYSRVFELSVVQYTEWNGWMTLLFGPTSIIAAGALIDRLVQKGKKDSAVRVMILGLCLLVPACIIYTQVSNLYVSLGLYLVIGTLGFTTITVGAPVAIVAITPENVRAQVIAIYYMVISMAGLLIGPSAVPFFTDSVFANEAMVGNSISLTIALFGIPMLVFSPKVLKAFQGMINK